MSDMTQVELLNAHAVDCDNYNGRRHLKKSLIDAASTITALEAEVARLRAVSAEYDTLIRHMCGGGDFHEFQEARSIDAAMRGDGGEG